MPTERLNRKTEEDTEDKAFILSFSVATNF